MDHRPGIRIELTVGAIANPLQRFNASRFNVCNVNNFALTAASKKTSLFAWPLSFGTVFRMSATFGEKDMRASPAWTKQGAARSPARL